MTPEQTVLVEGPESLASLCLHLRRMSDSQGDQIDADRLSHCADLIEAQAAELATLRAERDELQAAILSSAGTEYILEHPIETDAERMGRKSAVRGMMVRLGLYLQLEQAIDAAIALKGGAA